MNQDSDQGVPNARGRKSVAWRRDPVILVRLRDVERRHLSGQTNVAIADALGVDEATIRNDLKRLAELWLEQTKESQAEQRARVLAELEDVRTRAIAAAEFDEQCERAVLFGDARVIRDDKGSATFRGNKAAALGQARQATMDKAKILGIVVDKAHIAGPDGAPLTFTIAIDRKDDQDAPGDG
jgi:DNA-binding CsgD family transcriptional regulator